MDFTALPTLTGQRVTLEPLSADHVEELKVAVAEGELWRAWYTGIPSPDGMAAEVARRLALFAAGQMLPWAIRDNARGTVVGMTTFMNITPQHRHLEIGSTWLAPSAQRTGINTEAKLLLLRHAFEALDCIAVEFRTHFHNRQSRAAIIALGAKQDGVLRNHQLGRDGTLRDTVVFSIIQGEWPTVRLGLTERLTRHASAR
ncbi:Protein N-acetyltransferase, RimJ/RimL family [Cryobacterium psychrotolerans]|uniref:Protein N-acetyltransferase, RimJ/RimL family n=1 Tax=Cryobacterium psychrotolerans TaxID=386301 RepID=A0A1G9EPP7_9MICO|nr:MULTISPECIES: GNAT family protein [Cryobacterium]TFD42011.1 N-acetyltransferase [Cryobacterium sp. TMT1-2-1]TFD83669.1 N-acetyltransferase [Cryobacterium psychrotolerans]SDK78116.1 Protein N-acetyltransferase, RimJ/RimL family [Cryobacterium psychrotolerans]